MISVHPVGTRPALGSPGWVRVDIDLDDDVTVHGRTPYGSDVHDHALYAVATGDTIEWAVRYRRHTWIPHDIPVAALSTLADLQPDLYYLDHVP